MPQQSPPSGAVFLSYASQDAPAAERIFEALRAVGVDVWLDKNELRGGDAWDAQIKKRIQECALFIPLISAHTNARSEGYFRREWRQATRRLQDMADDVAFLVPVVIDETREADARVPEEFLRAQWTWLPGGETPPTFAQRVRQLLGGERAPVRPAQSAATGVHEPSARQEHSARPWIWFTGRGKRRLWSVGLAVVALLLVLGGGLFWYYEGTSDTPIPTPASTGTPVAAPALNEKSIAVLPFADMSAEKNQEHMSDGIAEELLNLLAQVRDLKVIARTSSFAFKGQNIDIAEIAKKLNVAHVLEGSVRTSGNRLRITAQLIRTADSTHLWSESYDRPFDDIFAVQDEIANAIVQALQIKFMGGTLTRREGGTQNLEAYQLYLRARNEDTNTESSMDAAADYLEQAIKLDPSYGSAWAGLGNVVGIKTENGLLPSTEGWEKARQLSQHALQLSPDLSDAHAYLGYINLYFDWDWMAASREAQRAIAINPTDTSGLLIAGILSRTLGRWDDAERQLRAVLVRDPLHTTAVFHLGLTYYLAGRPEDSEEMYRHLLELDPTWTWARVYLAKTLLALGKPERALTIVQEDVDEGTRLMALPVVLQAAGRQAEADTALQALIERWGDTGAYGVALTYANRGEQDRAFEWLERAYRQRDAGLAEIVGEPLFKNIANDPRFKAFLRKMKLPET